MTVEIASGTTVLHALRVKGFAETDVLAEVTRLDDVTVMRALEPFAAEDLVRRLPGADASGWVLTPDGRAEHERRLAAELEAAGTRARVTAAYAAFKALNPAVLQVCTDWQLRDGALNDHLDAAHDTAVVARLAAVHAEARPVLEELATGLPRFSGYRDRLEHALGRVQAGEREWFDKPLIDSYHQVWFELHEDLLATLGLDRATETGSEG